MEISELGEFGLIDRLAKDITTQNPTTIKGIGDDCAVLAPTEGMRTVVTTDLLVEGVHFDLTYVPLRHLGYKAVMVNLSDVFAMNAQPRQVTVSLAISSKFQVEDIEELYAGMRLACKKWAVDIVGGDTTASLTGLCISITWKGKKLSTTSRLSRLARAAARSRWSCCATLSPTSVAESTSSSDNSNRRQGETSSPHSARLVFIRQA